MSGKPQTFQAIGLFFSVLGTLVWAESAVQLPKAPEVSNDFGSKSKRAADMAAYGAVMAQATCSQMTALGMMEEDPQAKAVIMQTAAQQCAQAQESSKAAEENERNAEEMTPKSADMPKLSKTKSLTLPESPKESLIERAQAQAPQQNGNGKTREFPAPLSAQQTANNGTAANEPPSKESFDLPPELPTSAPPPLPPGRLSFDEEGKTNTDFSAFAATLAPTGRLLNATEEAIEESDVIDQRRPAATETAAVTGQPRRAVTRTSGRGSSRASRKKMRDLYSSMMGDNARPRFRPGGTISITERAARKDVNIFKYASYRYRQYMKRATSVRKSQARSIRRRTRNKMVKR